MLIQNTNLQQIAVQNQNIPEEGAVCLRLVLDFTVQQSWDLDLKQYVDEKKISIVQSIFVDATQTNVPVSITVQGSGQVITVKQQTQGYYPVLCPNPPRFNFQAATGIVTFYLCNSPIAGTIWSTV